MVPWVVLALAPVLLIGCASAPEVPQAPPEPIPSRLAAFAAAHARRDAEAIKSYFAAGGRAASPSMPKAASPDAYVKNYLADPFRLQIGQTEVLYSNEAGAKTRSRAHLSAPARFSLDEPLEVLWRFEGGQWKIVELEYPSWSAITGTWRKSGGRGEPSMELRVLPGGTYAVYAGADRSLARFRGRYTIESGTLTLVDSSAAEASDLDPSEGRYAVIVTRTNAEFRKISDENSWRSQRFEGIWTSSR